ncbi:MAG TPA: winged helix-turn-helix transcriptional regulator [Solirubrobacterales bacterium]|nr:winged helix-turn-helix transcriptional regulator [Solirubrobacterales bacterium]
MTGRSVNGDGGVARSGSRALSVLATPINGTILRCLEGGPRPLTDLRRECGSPAQTTLRAHLEELSELQAVLRHRRNRFPGVVECELTVAGRELVFVLNVVERWLQMAPDGPLAFGSDAAKAAIKALVDGWSSMMLRLLAARPLSLTELDGIIESLSYPSLQRRLTAMRIAGQLKPCPGEGKGTSPYGVTRWLRLGVGPLAAASRWERRHLPEETPPITPIDTEAGFLLTLPLLRLPEDMSGSCRLGVEMTRGEERRLAGALAQVEGGQVKTMTVRLNQTADAWAIGSAADWLHALIDADPAGLEVGGRGELGRALVSALHGALFKEPAYAG